MIQHFQCQRPSTSVKIDSTVLRSDWRVGSHLHCITIFSDIALSSSCIYFNDISSICIMFSYAGILIYQCRPGMPLNTPWIWLHLPFCGHCQLIELINATTVVAPERLIDKFIPTADAESLPLYHMVLKLLWVCVDVDMLGAGDASEAHL